MLEGRIESTVVPRRPLDVLAQQIVAMCALDEWDVEELGRVVRRAYPYSDLGPRAFESVLDMLSGRYPSDQFAELRPRIVWDRVTGKLRGRAGAQRLAVTNPGTIPDRGLYSVNLAEDGRRRAVSRRGGGLAGVRAHSVRRSRSRAAGARPGGAPAREARRGRAVAVDRRRDRDAPARGRGAAIAGGVDPRPGGGAGARV